MGLLLTKEEKISIDEALRVEIPCLTYLGANIDDSYMAKIFSHSYKHDDAFVKDVIQLIDLWSGAFPKGSNIPNTSAYAARLYELLCEDNKLTLLGIKMILDHLIQTKKQVPSIAEVLAEVEPIKQKYIAFKRSYEQFMRLYREAEQCLIKQLTDVGITDALSDILDFSELIKAWHNLCNCYPFPGCDIWMTPYRPDKNARLILAALSKPRHDNPLLVLFMAIVRLAKKVQGGNYDASDLCQEIKNLCPGIPSALETCGLPYIDELFSNIIDPRGSGAEIERYMRQVAQGHFSLEKMIA